MLNQSQDAQPASRILNRMSRYLTGQMALHTWVYEFAIIQRQLQDPKNQSVDVACNWRFLIFYGEEF